MDKRKTTITLKKVRRLLKVLGDKKKILIVSHDNPDPDTLGSAYALCHLFKEKLKADVTIGFSGIIGRAENRALITNLNIPLSNLANLALSEFDATVLVDCQQKSGRFSGIESLTPVAIIDHHPFRPESRRVEFHDIQSRIGATSTMITQYYMALGMEMDSRIATALLYGIKSDTRDLGRETGKYDLEAFLYLYPLANLKLLAKIEYAEVSPEYFRVYDRAIENAITYDGLVVSFMGDVDVPDIVAEMADTLIRLQGAGCALVGGYYEDHVFISLRTKDSAMNAGTLVQRVT
jgi:nanoRNase/pAp phosphatase (c-di-AMP/oligoRNAs hydrolase)